MATDQGPLDSATLSKSVGAVLVTKWKNEDDRPQNLDTTSSTTSATNRGTRKQSPLHETKLEGKHIYDDTSSPVLRRSHSSTDSIASFTRRRKRQRQPGKIQKPFSSVSMLWDGVVVYGSCVIVPGVFSWLGDFFWYEGGAAMTEGSFQHLLDYCLGCSQNNNSSYWKQTLIAGHLCSYLFPKTPTSAAISATSLVSVFSATDTWSVAVMALALAMMRLLLMEGLSSFSIPSSTSGFREQAAIVRRCPSIHLLSADYSHTPPLARKRRPVPPQAPHVGEGLRLPPLSTSLPESSPSIRAQRSSSCDGLGLLIEATAEKNELPQQRTPTSIIFEHFQQENLGDDSLDENFDNDDTDPLDDDLLLHRLSAVAAEISREEQEKTPRNRMYSGPRYATALFRLFYTTISVIVAYIYFSHSTFWPWYVGGSGSTKECWDLSGGVSGVLDGDFDHANAVLKRYFLIQWAYHWHSGAFFVLSTVLFVESTSVGSPNIVTRQYYRNLGQHALALSWIAFMYMFSSLRRLGAIGMFAFDVSSWFLHLLQACINAPQDSVFARLPVRPLHLHVVVPIYLVVRLGFWVMLSYSALVESQRWLEQLEQVLWKGTAWQMRGLFGVWSALLITMTLIDGKRLWYHEHVARYK